MAILLLELGATKSWWRSLSCRIEACWFVAIETPIKSELVLFAFAKSCPMDSLAGWETIAVEE
jgi:hypothetical protein